MSEHLHAMPRSSTGRSLVLLAALALGLAACQDSAPAATTVHYADLANWKALPVGTPAQPVDVFFIYPTTYFSETGRLGPTYSAAWNQTIAEAQADQGITDQVVTKTGVFFKAGTNVYAPYFRQASGLDVLNALLYGAQSQNVQAANQAMEVAYSDVAAAFDYYYDHYNRGSDGKRRPFILAGHSQGSNLTLMLLERKFADPALRAQLVVAYVVGWSVTSDDQAQYPASLGQIPICASAAQTGCIATWNTQKDAGDYSQIPGNGSPDWFGVVRPNAYSVNPLTWSMTGPNQTEATTIAGTAAQNLGAVLYPTLLKTSCNVSTSTVSCPTPVWTCGALADGQVQRLEIPAYTGAQSSSGALMIDPDALPAPATWASLNAPYNGTPAWFHNYDYNFFFRNIEQNVIDRIQAYTNGSIGAGRSMDPFYGQYCAAPPP